MYFKKICKKKYCSQDYVISYATAAYTVIVLSIASIPSYEYEYEYD